MSINEAMQYQTLEYVNKKVSKLFYGTASMPFMMGKDCSEMLDAARACGITALDTARRYMKSENVIGAWLESRNCREEMTILSKCGHPSMFGKKRVSEKEMRKDLKKSLAALRTDYIDIYLLHRDDPSVDVATVIETFNAMYAEGKIKAFGGSNWTHTRIEEANEYAYKHGLIPMTVSSPNFGLAYQTDDPWGDGITISGAPNEAAREWYRKNQMPVVAYSSICRGFFSGKFKSSEPEKAAQFLDAAAVKTYAHPENFERLRRCEELAEKKNATVAQIAMKWLFADGVNTFAAVSTSSPERLKSNVAALSIEMTKEEAEYLDLRRDSL